MRYLLYLFVQISCFTFGAGFTVAETNTPNVILIVTDDQGWGDLRLHGNEVINTPTMESLALSGAQFERFCVSPMCGPTRASLLTGRWNLRTGASWVSHGKEIVRLNETLLNEAFKSAGYKIGAFGKWHSGEYPQGVTTDLQAEDAKSDAGLKFRRDVGWAYDSILNWTDTEQAATWKLEALEPGRYHVTLRYGCLNEDGETVVNVNLGGTTRSATIRKIHDPVPKERTDADHNGVKTSGPIHVMTWAEIHIGDFDFPQGSTDLIVSIDPKGTSFELKEARVTLMRQ